MALETHVLSPAVRWLLLKKGEGPSSQKTDARNPGGQKAALSPFGEPRGGAGIAGYYEKAGLSSLFVCILSDEMAAKPSNVSAAW